MQDFLWTIIGWICKGVSVMALLVLIIGVCHVIKFLVTNGNRKWHYYEPDKPWKGGYWAPLLPDYPPYNEYEWNPETCRHEHKVTGEPLYDCKQPMRLSNKKAEKNRMGLGRAGYARRKADHFASAKDEKTAGMVAISARRKYRVTCRKAKTSGTGQNARTGKF